MHPFHLEQLVRDRHALLVRSARPRRTARRPSRWSTTLLPSIRDRARDSARATTAAPRPCCC